MPDVPVHYRDDRVEITRIVVGPLDNNVHVVRCRRTGESVLIDAADEPGQVLDLCRTLGVKAVLTTHGHRDHIQAVPAVRKAGIPVGIAGADAHMIGTPDFLIEDHDELEAGDLRLRAVHTPGHTPGSTCFVLEGSPVLLSGDTLFPGGPGATRGPGSDFTTIMRSLRERLFAALADGTVVLPGHGADTTIGAERPHLDEWEARGW